MERDRNGNIRKNIRDSKKKYWKKNLLEHLKNNRRKLMAAVLLLVVIVCLGYEGIYYGRLHQQEKQFEELREAVQVELPEGNTAQLKDTETEEQVPYCEPVYDFDELRESNGDIYAWITVAGTQVDYPVLQSETDNYYLEHNLDDSAGYPGCLYTNKCNTKDFHDYNTVIYGHNMKNGSMFGCLHSYEDAEFFEENREITVYTDEKRLTYEIYAAVKFTDVYIPAYYEVTTVEGRDAFLDAVREACEGSDVSHIDKDMEISGEDRILTLSTCVNGERPKRWLVIGRLADEAYYEAPDAAKESAADTEAAE